MHPRERIDVSEIKEYQHKITNAKNNLEKSEILREFRLKFSLMNVEALNLLRTKYNVVINNGETSIVIVSHKGEDKKYIVDTEDIEKYRHMPFFCNGDGYLSYNGYFNGKRKQCFFHRLVMNIDDSDKRIIDHINRNKSDNRKENLRIVTPNQNVFNSGMLSNNKSGIKGVAWNKAQCKWVAYIKLNQKHIHLGYFKNIEDATVARKRAEEKYFTFEVPQAI